ncbi:MAG: hypothetical protein NTU41_02280, partial [Chloroflexi bacterium]|nr:hypothetical protein [Chloroflexota bacterium]
MPVFALVSLGASCVSIIVACVVYSKNPKGAVNRVFAFFALWAAWGSFTEFGYRQAYDVETAVLWMRASLWPVTLAAGLHFALVFAGQRRLLQNTWTYVALYLPALVLAGLDLTTNYITAGCERYPWGWSPLLA